MKWPFRVKRKFGVALADHEKIELERHVLRKEIVVDEVVDYVIHFADDVFTARAFAWRNRSRVGCRGEQRDGRPGGVTGSQGDCQTARVLADHIDAIRRRQTAEQSDPKASSSLGACQPK
jgi:hypothetical protein